MVGEWINYSEGVLAKPTKINYSQITEGLVDGGGVRTSELQFFISKNLGRRGPFELLFQAGAERSYRNKEAREMSAIEATK